MLLLLAKVSGCYGHDDDSNHNTLRKQAHYVGCSMQQSFDHGKGIKLLLISACFTVISMDYRSCSLNGVASS